METMISADSDRGLKKCSSSHGESGKRANEKMGVYSQSLPSFISIVIARRIAEIDSMKVAIFSAKKYDREFLSTANASRHHLGFFEAHLNEETVGLATGFDAVCVFVNDHVNSAVIAKLRSLGVRLIALRCAGYQQCRSLGRDERRHHSGARSGVLAFRGGRTHDHPYAGAQPESASRL